MVQKGPDGPTGSQMVKKHNNLKSVSGKATWRMNLCSLQAINGSASVIVGIIHRGKLQSVVTHGQILRGSMSRIALGGPPGAKFNDMSHFGPFLRVSIEG